MYLWIEVDFGKKHFESRGSSSGMVAWKNKINSEGPRKLFAFALLHGGVVSFTFLIPMNFFCSYNYSTSVDIYACSLNESISLERKEFAFPEAMGGWVSYIHACMFVYVKPSAAGLRFVR